jgi:hypothetical protein
MNDEMVMKGGVEQSANPNVERMLNVSIYTSLHQKRKQCLEFALPKPGEICKHLAGAYNSKQSCPWASLSYFCMRKTSRKINATGRGVIRKNVSEKLSIINPL